MTDSKSLFHLWRPINLGFLLVIQVLCFRFFCVSENAVVFLVGIVLPTLLTAAAGYFVNNFFDQKKDELNNKPLVSLFQSKRWIGVYLGLNAVALLLCYLFTKDLLWWVLGAQILLFLYAVAFSNWLLIGNFIVALLAAFSVGILFISNTLFCGLANAWVLMVSVFLVTMSREMVKDIEDLAGDKLAGSQTLAVVFGSKIALVFANVFLLCNMVFIFSWGYAYLWQIDTWGTLVVAVLTLLAIAIIIYSMVSGTPNKWKNISLLLKIYMLFGLSLIPFLHG